MAHREGELLFEDRFDGRSSCEWAIPPVNLIETPEHGKVLHIEEGDPNAALWRRYMEELPSRARDAARG